MFFYLNQCGFLKIMILQYFEKMAHLHEKVPGLYIEQRTRQYVYSLTVLTLNGKQDKPGGGE